MEIRFVAHASFIVSTRGKSIISDPWLHGKVFNDGWALISPAAAVDWSGIDYIWVSHEHPDHFHLPTLKSVPDDDKRRITVLHQRHASSRMVEAIGKIGFSRVVELPLYQWQEIEPGIDVYCGSVGSMDSFLALRSEGKCALNLNDCVLNARQLRYVKQSIGPVDALFTQFSFANWVGNDSDELAGATRKIDQIREQVAILRPVHTVPFASFVYFCSQENQRMNAWINTPQAIRDLGIGGLHFMYPGQTWNLEEDAAGSAQALARYAEDYAGDKAIDPTPAGVDADKLLAAARACLETAVRRYPLAVKAVPALTIDVTDLKRRLRFDPSRKSVGYEEMTGDPARMEMCSQAAWYMFNFPWGCGTIEVSGMFRDRQRASQGPHPFFALQNRMTTRFLDMHGASQALRTLRFLWRKRWEISYRFLGRVQLPQHR